MRCTTNGNGSWTDAEMLDALAMRDLGMSMANIAGKLGRSRASVCGVLKRISDDDAAAESPGEASK